MHSSSQGRLPSWVRILAIIVLVGTAVGSGAATISSDENGAQTGALSAPAQDRATPDTPMEEFPTGDEQAVINRFAAKRQEAPPPAFSNALDHALAVLTEKAYPRPEPPQLIRETMTAICRETLRQTHHEISTAQQNAWAVDIVRSGSFDQVLNAAMANDPGDAVRNKIVEEGLKAMLAAMKPGFGMLLSVAEASDMKKLMSARERPAEEPGFIGLSRLPKGKPVVGVLAGGSAAQAGLQDGDVLLTVNGKKVGSGDEALGLIAGPVGSSVELKISRNGNELEFSVPRISRAAAGMQDRWVCDGVAYLKIPMFEGSDVAPRARERIKVYVAGGAKSILLDLRDNPGGRPEQANAVAGVFLNDKLLEVFQFQSGKRIGFKSHSEDALDLGVVILTNKNTGSAAEMLTMALHDNGRAFVVGEATAGFLFGKDIADLGDGHTIFFRTEPTILSPTSKDYSSIGIPPDDVIAPSTERYEEAILASATELAKTGKK